MSLLKHRGAEKSFLRSGIHGFSLTCCRNCKNVRVIFLGDLSTLSHILFLRLLLFRRLPPEGNRVTGFSVACGSLQHGYQRLTTICASLTILRYGCHRLTTICASLRSFKLCSLVQLMFAAVTPVPLPPLEMTGMDRGNNFTNSYKEGRMGGF